MTDHDPNHSWKEAKFSTKCWYLTLFAHHVCLIPTQQRYLIIIFFLLQYLESCNSNNYRYVRKIRALKELQRLTDDLVATEASWHPRYAIRNRELKEKWMAQIAKLTKY